MMIENVKREVLFFDKEKEREMTDAARYFCGILNRFVIPMARELDFELDVTDKDNMKALAENPDGLRRDFADSASVASNLAVARVLRTAAEQAYDEARKHYNVTVVSSFHNAEFIEISGTSLDSFFAKVDGERIREECTTYASESDIEARANLQRACDVLNEVFNGRGELFSIYIGIVGGKFLPAKVRGYSPIKRR